MNYTDVLICVPAYNEENTIKDIVAPLSEDFYVVVLDDASTDKTATLARQYGAVCKTTKERQGIAKSLLSGFEFGIYNEYDYVVTIDCESHSPQQVYSLLSLADKADVVIGSRFLPFSTYDNIQGKWYRPYLSQLASSVLNQTLDARITDWTSGFRVYRTDLLKQVLKKSYFSTMHAFQFEILARAVCENASVLEYPIAYKAGKSSFRFSTANEAFSIWLQIFNHYVKTETSIRDKGIWE